jgi:hypothetical protein
MRRLRLARCAAPAIVSIAAVGAGWLEDVPQITATEAVQAAEVAFERAGVTAEVDDAPAASTYVSRSQRRPVAVWTVRATVRTAPVVVFLARSGAQPVSIDDRSPNGSEYVLSDLEYGAVARSVDDPALTRAVRRNIALTLAAVLVVALSIAHAVLAERRSQESR